MSKVSLKRVGLELSMPTVFKFSNCNNKWKSISGNLKLSHFEGLDSTSEHVLVSEYCRRRGHGFPAVGYAEYIETYTGSKRLGGLYPRFIHGFGDDYIRVRSLYLHYQDPTHTYFSIIIASPRLSLWGKKISLRFRDSLTDFTLTGELVGKNNYGDYTLDNINGPTAEKTGLFGTDGQRLRIDITPAE